jgi:hypothetical protein
LSRWHKESFRQMQKIGQAHRKRGELGLLIRVWPS